MNIKTSLTATADIPFIWSGPSNFNLGRHGKVKEGDILYLNEVEAGQVADDPRYVPALTIVREALERGVLESIPVVVREAAERFQREPLPVRPPEKKPDPKPERSEPDLKPEAPAAPPVTPPAAAPAAVPAAPPVAESEPASQPAPDTSPEPGGQSETASAQTRVRPRSARN